MIIAGCATSYRIRFNGYLETAQPPFELQSSFCVLENKDARNPIFDSQIRSKIEKLLLKKGYTLKPADKADFLVSFTFVTGPGQTVTDVRREYTLGETGTIITQGPKGEVSTSTVLMPARTSFVPYQYTEYTAELTLEVIDASLMRSGKEAKKVWIGEASVAARDPDQRDIINYLLVAVFDHFAENTPGCLKASISKDDPRVKFIR